MKYLWLLISALYLPAGAGLLRQSVVLQSSASDRLLSLALALFCIELARMAIVDLNNIAAISAGQESHLETQRENPKESDHKEQSITTFKAIVVSTVVLELVGFYTALFLVAYGAAVVIFSQLWFNALANIQLWPGLAPAVTPFKLQQRIPVLVANVLALVLLSLWFIAELRLWLASGLLILITLFLVVKYCLPGTQPEHPSQRSSE